MHSKMLRPPRQGFRQPPASVDEMKLYETYPHLRASAVIYADVQADEHLHQFEDESKKKIKQIKSFRLSKTSSQR